MPNTLEEHVIGTRNDLELPYFKHIIEILKSENISTYLDIGSNCGEFCNIFFERIPSLKYAYLIEACEENFQFSLMNVKFKEKVIFINKAIKYNNNESYLIKLYNNVGRYALVEKNKMDKYAHTFREIQTENQGYIVKTYPYTIDTLENLKIPVVDHVKIDIEGGEFDIIPNSKYLQNIKFIDIEFHWDPDKHDIPNEQRETYIKSNFPNHSICYSESYGIHDNNWPFGRVFLRKN